MIVICKSCGKELETDLSSGVVICGNCNESTPITSEHIKLEKIDDMFIVINKKKLSEVPDIIGYDLMCAIQKAFVVSMVKNGYTHEQAVEMFGCVAEYVCINYVGAYNKGFNAGCAETRLKVEKGVVVKRDPDKDGFLPLTKEELTEFNGAFYPSLEKPVSRLQIVYDPALAEVQCETVKNNYEFWFRIQNCRAIVWLATRFNLDRIK